MYLNINGSLCTDESATVYFWTLHGTLSEEISRFFWFC
jgi:hypothetical protein